MSEPQTQRWGWLLQIAQVGPLNLGPLFKPQLRQLDKSETELFAVENV